MGGQAFLVVYSITTRNTFDEAIIMREKILRCKEEEDPPIVLVGNKCDLEDQRQVQTSEGQDLAKEWGEQSTFFETSAKEKINHEECFYQAVRLVRNQKNKSDDGNKGGSGGGSRFVKYCRPHNCSLLLCIISLIMSCNF